MKRALAAIVIFTPLVLFILYVGIVVIPAQYYSYKEMTRVCMARWHDPYLCYR